MFSCKCFKLLSFSGQVRAVKKAVARTLTFCRSPPAPSISDFAIPQSRFQLGKNSFPQIIRCSALYQSMNSCIVVNLRVGFSGAGAAGFSGGTSSGKSIGAEGDVAVLLPSEGVGLLLLLLRCLVSVRDRVTGRGAGLTLSVGDRVTLSVGDRVAVSVGDRVGVRL